MVSDDTDGLSEGSAGVFQTVTEHRCEEGVYVCVHVHQWCSDSEGAAVRGNSELRMQPSTQTRL